MAENQIDLKFIADYNQLERAEAVADRLEKRIQSLVNQEAKGRITTQQYSAQVNKLASEFQKASGGTIQARNSLLQYSRTTYQAAEALREMAAAAQTSQKAIHRKGVVTQQVGYQVGDLLVQVQSGTNFFVAFGQQATQLVGVLGMLNPRLIGLSAGLGIAIPLVTALAAMMSRSSQATKDADKELRSYSKAAETAAEKIAELRLEEEARADNQKDTTSFLLKQGVLQAQAELQLAKEAMNTSMEETGVLQAQIAAAEATLKIRQELLDNYKKELEIAEDRKKQEEQIEDAQDRAKERLEAYIETMAQYFRDVRAGYQAVAESQTTINAKTETYITKMAKLFTASKDLREELGNAAFEALRLGNVDIVKGVDAAAKSAAILAAKLGVSFGYAMNILQLGDTVKERQVRRGVRTGAIPEQALQDLPKTESQKAMEKLLEDRREAARKAAEKAERDAARAGSSFNKPNVSALVESLLTEQDRIDAWREESLAKLQDFNRLELEILGGHANAKLLIEKEYEDRVRALKVNKTQQTTSAISGILSGFAGLMDANNKKQFERQKKFQVAAAVVDGYSAAVSAWDKGMKMGGPFLAAAFTAGSLLKTGALIKSINSAQFGGGASQSAGGGASVPSVPPATASSGGGTRPQRVIIEGINRDSLITGEQLSNIFDQLYKENEDRGFVFEVAQ